MTENIYILDTSLFLDLFKIHPIDIYSQFWAKLNQELDSFILNGRLILTDFVRDEVIHTAGKQEDGSDDPAVMWMKERSKYLLNISNDFEIVSKAQKIIELFPQSANIDDVPPDADPFLIAYVLLKREQADLSGNFPNLVIITHEKRNKNTNIKKIQSQKPPHPEITKIRSICDYYDIESMDIFEFFRAEGWKF